MNRTSLMPAKILTGICAIAVSALAQTYTVSAKPGAMNFIQGDVSINGEAIWSSNLKTTFLNANDVLNVNNGKAEVLLTPGVFLRLGANSQIRMIKPSLIETQLEVISGETMIEVDDFVPGSSVAVMDHGSSTTLTKPGLFRFTEDSIASLDGKADVAFGDRKISLGKNKEVAIADTLHASKLDLNKTDDLYVWSNTRAQYNAAASYAGSMQAYNAGGYGFSSFSSPGWYWGNQFNSWMWMPGNGAYYSPFGWGFYGPALVAYAPVGYYSNIYPVGVVSTTKGGTSVAPAHINPRPVVVPVNPKLVGVATVNATTPAAFVAARSQAQNYANYYGLHTSTGAPAANLRGGQTFSTPQQASHAAVAAAAPRASYSGGGSGGYASSRAAAASSNNVSPITTSSAPSHGGNVSGGHSK